MDPVFVRRPRIPTARRRGQGNTPPSAPARDRRGNRHGWHNRVGGRLAAALLPHHRAYGSVHGGSCRVRLHGPQCPPPYERPALPRRFRPLLTASGPLTRHLLKAVGRAIRPPSTCSALRRSVPRLLWPLLTPAAPSRRLSAPVAHPPAGHSALRRAGPSPGAGRQASQGKTRDLHPRYPPHLRPGPPGDIGLRVFGPPRPEPERLICGSCSSVRLQLPSDPLNRLAVQPRATPLLFG